MAAGMSCCALSKAPFTEGEFKVAFAANACYEAGCNVFWQRIWNTSLPNAPISERAIADTMAFHFTTPTPIWPWPVSC